MQNSTHTIGSLLDYTRQSLAGLYPAREARAICHLLLENILGIPPATLYISLEQAVDAAQEQRVASAAAQLRQGRPVQQVLGCAEFYGLRFLVDERVLIPRPETEELVEWALKNADANAALRILDVGTGSGCIAVALAKRLPCAVVHAWDISEEALKVARKNARLNGVQVHFEKRDVLRVAASGARLSSRSPAFTCKGECAAIGLKFKISRLYYFFKELVSSLRSVQNSKFKKDIVSSLRISNLKFKILNLKFKKERVSSLRSVQNSKFKYDLIVSNPPYVCESEKAQMQDNVLRYEPHAALFVEDSDPLVFYTAIARLAQKALSESGEIFVEVNERLGTEVVDVFTRSGFMSVELRCDLNGKPRMISAKR